MKLSSPLESNTVIATLFLGSKNGKFSAHLLLKAFLSACLKNQIGYHYCIIKNWMVKNFKKSFPLEICIYPCIIDP